LAKFSLLDTELAGHASFEMKLRAVCPVWLAMDVWKQRLSLPSLFLFDVFGAESCTMACEKIERKKSAETVLAAKLRKSYAIAPIAETIRLWRQADL